MNTTIISNTPQATEAQARKVWALAIHANQQAHDTLRKARECWREAEDTTIATVRTLEEIENLMDDLGWNKDGTHLPDIRDELYL